MTERKPAINWIPVEQALPELNEIVLVSYPSGYDGAPIINFGCRDDGGEGWCWSAGGRWGVRLDQAASWNGIETDDDYKVTHWARIESPYVHGEQATKER